MLLLRKYAPPTVGADIIRPRGTILGSETRLGEESTMSDMVPFNGTPRPIGGRAADSRPYGGWPGKFRFNIFIKPPSERSSGGGERISRLPADSTGRG